MNEDTKVETKRIAKFCGLSLEHSIDCDENSNTNLQAVPVTIVSNSAPSRSDDAGEHGSEMVAEKACGLCRCKSFLESAAGVGEPDDLS